MIYKNEELTFLMQALGIVLVRRALSVEGVS